MPEAPHAPERDWDASRLSPVVKAELTRATRLHREFDRRNSQKWAIPLPLGLLESAAYAGDRVKILHFKELRGKIFRIKDLALRVDIPTDLCPSQDVISRSH
jgi:hypothetical protein